MLRLSGLTVASPRFGPRAPDCVIATAPVSARRFRQTHIACLRPGVLTAVQPSDRRHQIILVHEPGPRTDTCSREANTLGRMKCSSWRPGNVHCAQDDRQGDWHSRARRAVRPSARDAEPGLHAHPNAIKRHASRLTESGGRRRSPDALLLARRASAAHSSVGAGPMFQPRGMCMKSWSPPRRLAFVSRSGFPPPRQAPINSRPLRAPAHPPISNEAADRGRAGFLRRLPQRASEIRRSLAGDVRRRRRRAQSSDSPSG